MSVRPHCRRLPALWLVFILLTTIGCRKKATPRPQQSPDTASEVSTASTLPPVEPAGVSAARLREARFREATARIEAVLAEPAVEGAQKFEANRAAMVARAKSEPVFFVRPPRLAATTAKEVSSLREQLDQSEFGWRTVRDLRNLLEKKKGIAKQVLLPDGYLYSETPQLAFALVSQVRPVELFDSEDLWIQRGALTMRAKKDPEQGYVYVDGPEEGGRVRLLHLDRLSDTGTFAPALHRDFRTLRGQLHFEQARVEHVTANAIVANLRYGEHWVRSLLTGEDVTLSLAAEAVEPAIAEALELERDRLRRKAVAVSALRGAMRAMIDEALPFDEPKTEVGQEDGKLRPEWRMAYYSGRSTYEYNEDRYEVFDRQGRPRVPQVCIDFMIDTFERAGGAWWLPRSANLRQKSPGRLDLGDFSRSRLRQTAYLRELAVERSDMFEVLDIPENKRIELGYKEQFFNWLGENALDFQAGDMILIRGLTPWDEVDEHTHSFFIYETDPLTGVPIAIAGNAGPANLWSWETEARRTPKRTVRTRIRPKLEWLETFLDTGSTSPLVPPPLVSGAK